MSAVRLDDRLVHERSLELGAIAIDFDLTIAEREELDAHLAGCGSMCAPRGRPAGRCAGAELAADRGAICRVDRAVEAAIERRTSGPQRLALLVAASLLLLAMLGAVVAGAYLLRTLETRPTTDLPLPTAPVAVEATIGPDALPPVVGETWESLPVRPTSRTGLIEAVTFGGSKLVGVGRGDCDVDSDGEVAARRPRGGRVPRRAWVGLPSPSGLALGAGVDERTPRRASSTSPRARRIRRGRL